MPGLSTQDALLLTLAEQQLHSLLPTPLMKSMNGFFSQARSQLEENGTPQREREWLDKVRVVSTSQPLLPPKINPNVFDEVSRALYGNQWLDVDYQNAEIDSKEGKFTKRGNFAKLEKAMDSYKKRGITALYLMGILERDNNPYLNRNTNEVEYRRPDAAPLAITCR